MFESLRARLLLWYSVMLAVVMAISSGAVLYVSWRAHLAGIDDTLTARAGTLASALHPAALGTFDLALPAAPAPGAVGNTYHVLWNTRGGTIDKSDPDLEVPRPLEAGVRTREGRREIAMRAVSGAIILVGVDLAAARAQWWSLAGTIAAVGVGALMVSLAGGWWLVTRALAPVGWIGRTARAMADGDFGARIPVDRVETEFGQLARALNDAFDRLHASLERQRRFTADASHELRTPLATLSTEAQWARARPRTSTEYERSLDVVMRASGRMQLIVDRLLTLARAEADADTDRRIPVDLADLVGAVVQDLAPLAAGRHVSVMLTAETTMVNGDPDRLGDAFTNVVANAIQYSGGGGRVDVSVAAAACSAHVVVTDFGTGIAPADLPRVFEPFFRADPARSREAGGAGLGLAVVHAVIVSHDGSVTCTSELGRGTSVSITLPRLD